MDRYGTLFKAKHCPGAANQDHLLARVAQEDHALGAWQVLRRREEPPSHPEVRNARDYRSGVNESVVLATRSNDVQDTQRLPIAWQQAARNNCRSRERENDIAFTARLKLAFAEVVRQEGRRCPAEPDTP
eukprot:4378930-Prymnesium_polylepis.1